MGLVLGVLHIILADSELETVPREIANHRVIKWSARRLGRKPTEILLNSSLHYPAMRRLPDGDRRGRPDIVHICLLLALDTPLNREGLLRTYIHTRHNKIITVDPSTRLPRMFNRFTGLIEHLFLTGEAPPEKPLLTLENASLTELVGQIKPKKVISFSQRGQMRYYKEFFINTSKEDDVCVIIGGFPHGDFLSNVTELSNELFSIDPEPLRAPTVLMRAIFAYEDAFDIQKTRRGRCSNVT